MSLNRRDTVLLRTGLPGSGKSWSLCKYIVDEWIPAHDGVVYTNVPVKVDAIAEYFAGRAAPAKREAIRQKVSRRVVRIPEAVEQSWLDGESNPGVYFRQVWEDQCREEGIDPEDTQAAVDAGLEHPLAKALVVIDEAGKMWPAEPDKERKPQNAAVKAWIATLRHYGARVCFVLQDEMQLDAGIRRLRAVEVLTTKMNTQPEPLTGAILDHWFQVWAKLTGYYPVWMREEEFVKQGKDLISVRVYSGLMSPRYFQFYDSHNNPGELSGAEEEPEFKRFGWIRFLMWLTAQNAFAWGWRSCLLLVLWLVFLPPFSLFFVGVNRVIAGVQSLSGADMVGAVGGEAAKSTISKSDNQASTPGVNESAKNAGAPIENRQPVKAEVFPVGIVGEWILLSDGSEVTRGQSINGRRVVGMDAVGRIVDLADGSMLRLQTRPSVRPAAASHSAGPAMAGSLPAPGGTGIGGGGSSEGFRPASLVGSERRAVGSGDAPPSP